MMFSRVPFTDTSLAAAAICTVHTRKQAAVNNVLSILT